MTISMQRNAPSGDKNQENPTQQPGAQTKDQDMEVDSTVAEETDNQSEFPVTELAKLDEMINRPRWVVPVLPNGELELLLEAAINLCKKGIDTQSEHCQNFFKDGLTISFTKILTDEAVSGWKYEIHKCIYKNAERLVKLCVLKLPHDWFPLLELLAMVLNPHCKFHCYNGSRPSETVPPGTNVPDEDIFARSTDVRQPKGWLVDLVNYFGDLGGFQIVQDRFKSESQPTASLIAALIKPFGYCYEVLTPYTVQKYFMPIVAQVPAMLDALTDEELKRESKVEAKNDTLSGIVKALKCLASRVPHQEETIKNLEIFRLKMILRLLQISSFNGKMNALNEVNKVIGNVTLYTHRHGQLDEDDWLNAEKMAEWLQQNKVLSIVLRDSLHQPQYVEKLEKIIRFVIKEKTLSLEDLDRIWEAQAGKHEAIVKNVHDLLAKLAWDFSAEQLDHLFQRFQESWTKASKKQREKLLELIRRLAEDDKEGVMAHKVLGLLWNLAHSEDVPTDIMDQALSAHIKILDYSCSQDRDAQKMQWVAKFVEELNNDKWVLPALKQIKEICQLFSEAPQTLTQSQRSPHVYYRNQVINQLQTQHSIVMLVAKNLNSYMAKARKFHEQNPKLESEEVIPDGRANHNQQVLERLRFLRFLLKDGQLWLCEPQAKQVWTCLAENATYASDRENCFRWFTKLMGDEPDLDPEITKDFFEQNILQFDPALLTESGMNCFERFFKNVNTRDGRLITKRRGGHMMDSLELIGLEYLWRVVLYSPDEVANKAIILLKDTYTNLGPKLQANQGEIHEDFLQVCHDRLKAAYDTVTVLERDEECGSEAARMMRVLTVLRESVAECDDAYGEERIVLPLYRACRGKHITLVIRLTSHDRQADDFELYTHSNDTMGSVRRQIIHKCKPASGTVKIDLFLGGELMETTEDKKLLSTLPIRDKTLLTAKVNSTGSNMPSSPDSSSDSSTGSPHRGFDRASAEAENCLPGVIMANNANYVQFLFKLADLGCRLGNDRLRDCARNVLRLIPPDNATVKRFRSVCLEGVVTKLESMFFLQSHSQVLYHLEVVYSLLMPASNTLSPEVFEFQRAFLRCGGISVCLCMLTKNNFLSGADIETKRAAYVMLLRLCKLLFTTLGHAQVAVIAAKSDVTPDDHKHVILLQKALAHIPSVTSEHMTRTVAQRLGSSLLMQATDRHPTLETAKALQKLAWCAGVGRLKLLQEDEDDIHTAYLELYTNTDEQEQPEQQLAAEDVDVFLEALESLTVCLVLCPTALETLNKERSWQSFIIDCVLLSKSRLVRNGAADQFWLIASKCAGNQRPLVYLITLLFTVLDGTAKEHAAQANEYFQLLWRLLNHTHTSHISLQNAEALLNSQIQWLRKVREETLRTKEMPVDESLLEGRMGIMRELLYFHTEAKKHHIGCEAGGPNLIKELMEDFIFSASVIVRKLKEDSEGVTSRQAMPICSSSATLTAAFDLLVALCTGCKANFKVVGQTLANLYYYDGCRTVTEWEYQSRVGLRPPHGFVGLKNAGATCYMNSVLQQLFMIDPIRSGLLTITVLDEEEEDDTDMETLDAEDIGNISEMDTDTRKEYNLVLLYHVQVIFAHLTYSKLQYYVPKHFWKHFRLMGEPVNLREQHDALEFFNSIVDSLDDALKELDEAPVLDKVLGGSFADQKICKTCPHRYAREEPFTSLNVDIRNHQNLTESLEQYVKGDLLEGANAYHCEKCDKKVDTVKRMCIKKLPPMLAIQLKRFDYDWERECAIKFNDYFEFPRELEMEPYTAAGLARREGETIAEDGEAEKADADTTCTKYRLVGVVVHSGQASGGHYYSYILHRPPGQTPTWYKFDDGEVSECKMEEEEELKNQCFGGEYLGEMFDHMHKRMQYRRQKRWWNAYILMYERLDVIASEKEITKSFSDLSLSSRSLPVRMTPELERLVGKQNLVTMHKRSVFCPEYYQFVRKLLLCNHQFMSLPEQGDVTNSSGEDLALMSVWLGGKFLFTHGFHTKKTLRGPANDWYDALCTPLRFSKKVRHCFALEFLFVNMSCFAEYLLECPSAEVRNTFMKILVLLAHFSLKDGPIQPSLIENSTVDDPNATLSDHILVAVLNLLKKEVSEYGRHIAQYFHLFLMYANLGLAEKQQLLNLRVPAMFIQVALDEGPGPPIKYQYAELGKLYAVVGQLVRCCDDGTPLPNPHGEPSSPQPLMVIQPQVSDYLFARTIYVKKLVEDCSDAEETAKLLKFGSWENPHFSSTVLSELLWQVAYSYTYELRPYMHLLLQMLMLEDSWQNHRIHNALKGIPDDRDGLFDTIQRAKNHYQKRAYQCIKMMVTLFSDCSQAANMLQTNNDIKRKWRMSVEWLNDELERPYSSNTQYYSNWSPPAHSNETSNGYFLERSNSARMTLAKAYEVLSEDEAEATEDDRVPVQESSEGRQSQSDRQNLNWRQVEGSGSTVVTQQKIRVTGARGDADSLPASSEQKSPVQSPQRDQQPIPERSDSPDQGGSSGSSKRVQLLL